MAKICSDGGAGSAPSDTPCIEGNLMKPPPYRQCGARTRDGDPCKNWGIPPSGRCRMQEVRSPLWFASPCYVHGRYSRYGYGAALARGERQPAKAQARAERIVAAERAQREAREARESRHRSAVVFSAEFIEAICGLFEADSA